MSGADSTGICLVIGAIFLGLGAWTILGAWCFVWVFRMIFVKQWDLGLTQDEEREQRKRELTEEGM